MLFAFLALCATLILGWAIVVGVLLAAAVMGMALLVRAMLALVIGFGSFALRTRPR
jgi:hypothetical protein